MTDHTIDVGPVWCPSCKRPYVTTLTEDERELVWHARENGAWAMPGLDPDGCTDALVAIIDRLSAAPVDDRVAEVVVDADGNEWVEVLDGITITPPALCEKEHVPEGWRVEWPLSASGRPFRPRLVPVSPSVDPEEG